MTPIRFGSAGWIFLGITLVVGLAACAPRSGPTIAARPGEVSPALLRQLRAGPVKEREAAAQALGRTPGGVASTALKQALGDPDARVRVAVIAGLGLQRMDAAVPGLFTALEDADPRVSAAAHSALARFGAGAIVPLAVARLDHRDPRVRQRALALLAAHGREAAAALAPRVVGVAGAAPLLVQAFVALGDPALELVASRLVKLPRPGAPAEDDDASEGPSPVEALLLRFGVRAAAVLIERFEALVKGMPDSAFKPEEAPEGLMDVMGTLSPLLTRLGPAVARPVVALLRRQLLAEIQQEKDEERRAPRGPADDDGGPGGEAPGGPAGKAAELRVMAMKMLAELVLAELKPPPVAAVAALVRDPSAAVRAAGLELLEGYDHPEVAAVAIRALRDREDEVRRAAVKVLARRGDATVIPHLVPLLKDESFLMVSAVTSALVARRAVEARGPLCDALLGDSTLAALRRAALLRALAALGSIPCAPDVMKLLASKDKGERAAAVLAAGTLGTPAAAAAVRLALRDPEEPVRLEAVRAAGAILGRAPDRLLAQAVRAALEDALLAVRLAAAAVAGAVADRAAVPALIKLLDLKDAPARAAALAALGQVGDRSALRAVEQAFVDDVAAHRRDAHLAYYLITGKLHATALARMQAAPTCVRMTVLLACYTATLPAARRPVERAPLLPILLKALETTTQPAALWTALEATCVKALADLTPKARAVPAARRCLPR